MFAARIAGNIQAAEYPECYVTVQNLRLTGCRMALTDTCSDPTARFEIKDTLREFLSLVSDAF